MSDQVSEETGDTLKDLRVRLRQFASDRDWNQFHSPKNLAMALSVEVGELLEHFQWLTDAESTTLSSGSLAEISDELADVLLYLVRLADTLGIDLAMAASAKIVSNAEKYPVDKARGSKKKYTKL